MRKNTNVVFPFVLIAEILENEKAIELETLEEKSQISQHFHAVSRGHEKGSQRPISITIDIKHKVSQVLNSSFAVQSARTFSITQMIFKLLQS